MNALSCLLLAAVAAAGSGPPTRPVWEKIFDGGETRAISLIDATGRDDWVAGGVWGVATAREGRVNVESTHGHGVLGLFTESPRSVYALGEGELIWHFDGGRWTEEHVAPMPPGGRRPFAEHMLHVAYYPPALPAAPLVALGLSLVLVRQPDGTWAPPPQDDRAQVRDAGLLGPRQLAVPARCERAGWRWLGKDRGAFYCHDRRMFVWDAGTMTFKGKMPGDCFDGLDTVVEVKGELYASCQSPSLWKTEGEAWRRIELPREKGLRELPSISFADGCLFAAGGRTVWRTCGP